MKIKLGVNAPPLHEQLGVEASVVKSEQVILDLLKFSHRLGVSDQYIRQKHFNILNALKDKGLIGELKKVVK